MLIPLICTQCGGKLEVENSQVVLSGDTVVVVPNQSFQCPHCGMKYLPGERIKHASETPMISIGGSVSGSAIVVGNGVVINNHLSPVKSDDGEEIRSSANPDSEMTEAARRKQRSQWWQFWKK